MSEDKNKQIFRAELKEDNKIEITLGTKFIPSLLTALKLLELQIDNIIIGASQPERKVVIANLPDIIGKKLRGIS